MVLSYTGRQEFLPSLKVKFWTWIKPHSLDESGATCAARLLWRTDAACCKEIGMEAAQRQALAAPPTATGTLKSRSTPVNNKEQRF